jgi:hypothetical protein
MRVLATNTITNQLTLFVGHDYASIVDIAEHNCTLAVFPVQHALILGERLKFNYFKNSECKCEQFYNVNNVKVYIER